MRKPTNELNSKIKIEIISIQIQIEVKKKNIIENCHSILEYFDENSEHDFDREGDWRQVRREIGKRYTFNAECR